ncbi:myb domain protein 88 [Euphorbia peplus]|nr:myb domain protein 88 [Euphorbia peplus]
MQETKKKINEDSKKKERHIVTWTQQEDDILRHQINLLGTENWAIIASKFKDKTTRQCRRRWYTYLNSDFKKGGWSPEEDMLLCEAQKIFGNRWTEIAKVVSGRTDNAVKNRFSTLCKKKAKYEALAKENKSSFINSNNKRILFHNGSSADGTTENAASAKKIRRSHIPDDTERSHIQCGKQQPRPPLSVLAQNIRDTQVDLRHDALEVNEVSLRDQNSNTQGTFLRKDDPKITALMQQAELLSSLALKVNTENTEQSLENAWKVLQDFLNQSKENDIFKNKLSDMDFQLEDFRDLIEELRSLNDESQSWRQPDVYDESPASSEYSTGSTTMPYTIADKAEETQTEIVSLHKDIGDELQPVNVKDKNEVDQCEKEISSCVSMPQGDILPALDEQTNNDIVGSASLSPVFSSPLQVTPLFRSLAAGIPSPKFSESERNFLIKTLGVESPCPNTSISCSQPPPCRRALLQSL